MEIQDLERRLRFPVSEHRRRCVVFLRAASVHLGQKPTEPSGGKEHTLQNEKHQEAGKSWGSKINPQLDGESKGRTGGSNLRQGPSRFRRLCVLAIAPGRP